MGSLARFKEKLKGSFNYELEKVKVGIVASLVEIMQRKNISQSDIARSMEVSEANISKIFRADQNITVMTMVKLANAVGARVEVVFHDEDMGTETDTSTIESNDFVRPVSNCEVYQFDRERLIRMGRFQVQQNLEAARHTQGSSSEYITVNDNEYSHASA